MNMVKSTVVRNSSVGDQWIAEMVRANPVSRLLDAAGKPTENFTTGLVRLAFVNFFEKKKSDDDGEGKYGCGLLFAPGSDFSLLWDHVHGLAANQFQGRNWQNPFHKQDEKAMQYTGFTPGLYYANCTTRYQPIPVDGRRQPILDRSKVHAGVWAIGVVNAFPYTKKRTGIGIGLQSIMIVADDDNLEGGAMDPNVAFAGAKLVPAATGNATAMLMGGVPNAAPPPPPAPSMNFGALPRPTAPAADDDIASML